MTLEHKTYSLSVRLEKFRAIKVRYNKRKWVPVWLWKLVSEEDYGDLLLNEMLEQERNYREQISKSIEGIGNPPDFNGIEP